MSSANAFNLDKAKFLSTSQGLNKDKFLRLGENNDGSGGEISYDTVKTVITLTQHILLVKIKTTKSVNRPRTTVYPTILQGRPLETRGP